MRKVRDFDAELKALNERAKLLRARKIQQFGELIEATGADTLEPDLLAGALLARGRGEEQWDVTGSMERSWPARRSFARQARRSSRRARGGSEGRRSACGC